MAKPNKLAPDLVDVLRVIPLARRRLLRDQIGRLCDRDGVENTFMENRAKLFSGLKSDQAKKNKRKTTELKALHMCKYWIEGRFSYEKFAVSLVDAAKIMGVTTGSLKVRLSLNTYYSKESDYPVKQGIASQNDLLTCTKMTPDELDAQLKIFNETIKNNPKYTNEVQ